MEPIEPEALNFRPRRLGELQRALADEGGTPFWRIVGAVFLALVLYGLLEAVVTSIVVRRATSEMEGELQRMEAQFQRSILSSVDTSMPQRRQSSQELALPGYFGPIEARRSGMTQACINGRVSDRLPSGWSQTSVRCRAVSE